MTRYAFADALQGAMLAARFAPSDTASDLRFALASLSESDLARLAKEVARARKRAKEALPESR